MTTTTTTTTISTAKQNPKKANLLDHHSIKHLLDESVSEIVASLGYNEDVRMSNVRLLIGSVIIVIALFAQFYYKKFPENKNFLIGCILLYVLFNGILQLIVYTKEKNAILFTYPPEFVDAQSNKPITSFQIIRWIPYREGHLAESILRAFWMCRRKDPADHCRPIANSKRGSFNSTGLMILSKLPRFSDMYTLTIASADPQSISAKPTVEVTKSVTKWFTKEGVLVEGLFWKDVNVLINDYAKEGKKSK